MTKFKVGDVCAVGCFVDACLDCPSCKGGDEQYCIKGQTLTYNGDKTHGRVGGNQSTKTAGGYSAANTVLTLSSHFVNTSTFDSYQILKSFRFMKTLSSKYQMVWI